MKEAAGVVRRAGYGDGRLEGDVADLHCRDVVGRLGQGALTLASRLARRPSGLRHKLRSGTTPHRVARGSRGLNGEGWITYFCGGTPRDAACRRRLMPSPRLVPPIPDLLSADPELRVDRAELKQTLIFAFATGQRGRRVRSARSAGATLPPSGWDRAHSPEGSLPRTAGRALPRRADRRPRLTRCARPTCCGRSPSRRGIRRS